MPDEMGVAPMSHLTFAQVSRAALAAAAFSLGAAPLAVAAQDADLTVMPPVSTSFQPAKTAWGDPDLRGTWPINDVAELPVNRPDQYGDRFFKTDEELAAEQARVTDLETRYSKEEQEETIGTGHWIEYLGGARRTSMVVSPATGKLPPMTPQAEALHRAGRSSWTPNTSFDWVTDFDSWDRCVSRAFPAS